MGRKSKEQLKKESLGIEHIKTDALGIERYIHNMMHMEGSLSAVPTVPVSQNTLSSIWCAEVGTKSRYFKSKAKAIEFISSEINEKLLEEKNYETRDGHERILKINCNFYALYSMHIDMSE